MIGSDDLAFFSVIAGSASLAESARRLNVTPPAVTQRLRALEARAGVRLVDRSTREISLTDEGALMAAHGVAIGDALAALSEALADRRNAVTGHLRIAAPHGFGRAHVAPVVDAFARAHTAVTVSLDLSDHPGGSSIDGCDIAIHIGAPASPDRIVTTLAPNRRVLCASPDYLRDVDPVRVPVDLARHRCLVLRENSEDVSLWRFTDRDGGTAAVRVEATMSSTDGSVIRDWALAGGGIALRSEWDIAADLADGRLCRLLPEWEPPAADVVAMVGARHGRSARTTAFLAALRQSLAPPPWRQ